MSHKDTPTRQCAQCNGSMALITKQKGSLLFPFAHGETSYQLYRCSECNQEIKLPLPNVMFIQFMTALSTVIALFLLVQSKQVLSLFSINILLSIGIITILLLFFTGGIWNTIALTRNLRLCHHYPAIHHKTNIPLHILGLFLYSLTPFIYWGGMGFLNDYYLHIPEGLSFFIVLPGFAPFYFADKFGFAPSTVFLLTASYPVIGFIIMWNT